MKITALIKEILLHKDFIIVPGLGGFVCEYKSAKISSDKKTIAPPSKTIIFKNKLAHDDGELNNYIQKTQKVDKKNAQQIIEKFVEETKTKLEGFNEVEIEGIGTLYMDSNKDFHLRLNIRDNLLLNSYGMTKVNVHPLEKEPVENNTTINGSNNRSNNNNSDDMSTKNTKKTLIWVLSIVVVLAGAAILIIPHTTSYLQNLKVDFAGLLKKDNTYGINDTSKIGRDLDAQTEKRNALYYEEDKSQKITSEDGIPDSLVTKYSGYSKFYIIAGSYTRYENAARLKNTLKREGFEPEILISTEKELYRVTYRSYTDRRMALKELYKLQEDKQTDAIWILNI